MISYERIHKIEGINLEKQRSECMVCDYWYFKDIGFKYQRYICNGCHDFSMSVQNLKDFFISTINNGDYRAYIANVDKKAAIYFLNNSVLDDKGVI